eukprot:1468315-Prymnesium_polylepis.1
MLKQWQQRQEERLDEGQTQQRAQEGTPTGVTRQGRRAIDGTTSPAKLGGSGRAVRAEASSMKQSGLRGEDTGS